MKEKVMVSLDPCKIKELDEIRGIIEQNEVFPALIQPGKDPLHEFIGRCLGIGAVE